MNSAQTVEEINSLVSERAALLERTELLAEEIGHLRDDLETRAQERAALLERVEALEQERDRLVASNEAAWKRVATAEAKLLELEHRPLHLVVRDGQWVDDRCGCAYHPDDDNNTHRGGPHVHECAEHQEPQESKP